MGTHLYCRKRFTAWFTGKYLSIPCFHSLRGYVGNVWDDDNASSLILLKENYRNRRDRILNIHELDRPGWHMYRENSKHVHPYPFLTQQQLCGLILNIVRTSNKLSGFSWLRISREVLKYWDARVDLLSANWASIIMLTSSGSSQLSKTNLVSFVSGYHPKLSRSTPDVMVFFIYIITLLPKIFSKMNKCEDPSRLTFICGACVSNFARLEFRVKTGRYGLRVHPWCIAAAAAAAGHPA